MKRVFLAGTTAGTTWRQELIVRLRRRGVRIDQIVNPQLPEGVKYTQEHMLAERHCKDDPNTIILIVICPAVLENPPADPEIARERREQLGPISMHEVGKYAFSQPHRTGVVLLFQEFTEGKRPRKVLEGLAREHREDFAGKPPYLPSFQAAEDWLVAQLVN